MKQYLHVDVMADVGVYKEMVKVKARLVHCKHTAFIVCLFVVVFVVCVVR